MYTFVVETGEGLDNATSYAATADVDTFATFWGYPDWTLLDEEDKETLLIKATRLLDESFTFASTRLVETQSLAWPRGAFKDTDGRLIEGIPAEIVDAVSEIAILLENYSQDDLSDIRYVIRQQFGDSEDEYSAPVMMNSNPFFTAFSRIASRLKKYGYGGGSMRQVRLSRG